MTDLICRKTMQRCQTPGMCMPHGGCKVSVLTETNVRYSDSSAGTQLVRAPIGVYQALVDLPGQLLGCGGPVKSEVVLADDHHEEVARLQGEIQRLQQAPGTERVDSTWLAQLRREFVAMGEELDRLRDEAELSQAIEHAAEHLPEGWIIKVMVERHGSGVELFDDTANEVEFASNHETMAESVRDAVEAAKEAVAPEADPGQPPAPSNWKAIAPPITDDERRCHEPDCWCCDGTGRDPADGGICKWNNGLPF